MRWTFHTGRSRWGRSATGCRQEPSPQLPSPMPGSSCSSPRARPRSCPTGCATTASATNAASCRPTSAAGNRGRSRPRRSPSAVEVVDGELRIDWANGHRSTYGAAEWDKIRITGSRGAWTARLWRTGYEIERFDHHQSIADQVTRRGMFEALRRDGAVVVTGSPTEPGTVIDLLRSLGLTLRDSSLGLIFDVKLDPAGYNIAFTAEEVPPHNDNAQYTHPPSGQVLAMLVNEAQGGNSVVVDGWSVLDRLNREHPEAIDVLARVEVGFRQYSTEADAFTRAPLVVRDRAGRFVHLRFSNQLMQPLAFDDADLAKWYEAYRLLGAAIADPANHVSFRLSAGDTLFVNGYRVLHARTAYQPDGPRHLQDVYFEMDDVFGHLARMSGEAQNAMVVS